MIARSDLQVSILAGIALCWIVSTVKAEPYIGQFELKTLESEPGRFEFQSQNAWSWNQPRRRSATGAEGIVFDENSVIRSRHALELEAGITRRLKTRVGIELEKERIDEPETLRQANDFGSMRLEEFGAELIAILVPREEDGFGFGIVAELEWPVDEDEARHLVLGPIFEFQSGRWFASVIPTLVHAFGGEAEDGGKFDNKWDFAYATQLAYTFSDTWKLALEGYGTIERLGRTGHPSESARLFGDFDQHRLGPVLYYTTRLGGPRYAAQSDDRNESGTSLTIGIGLLEGLNDNTPEHTLKLSVEVDF